MTPEQPKSPRECLVDRGKLDRIDTNVNELAKEFRVFISSEGPFVDVRTRVKLLESKTDGLVAKVTGMVAACLLYTSPSPRDRS